MLPLLGKSTQGVTDCHLTKTSFFIIYHIDFILGQNVREVHLGKGGEQHFCLFLFSVMFPLLTEDEYIFPFVVLVVNFQVPLRPPASLEILVHFANGFNY